MKGKVFYGAAIQGNRDRLARQSIHQGIIEHIKRLGYTVASEHVIGSTYDETAKLLTESLGALPPKGMERTKFVRNKMIELVESDVKACVFEVSVPSLGTGIEIAHAYLRSRMGLSEVPILALYEKDFWPQGVSSMVRGLSSEEHPNFCLEEYGALSEAYTRIDEFFATVVRPS
jgi:hypothetical protein